MFVFIRAFLSDIVLYHLTWVFISYFPNFCEWNIYYYLLKFFYSFGTRAFGWKGFFQKDWFMIGYNKLVMRNLSSNGLSAIGDLETERRTICVMCNLIQTRGRVSLHTDPPITAREHSGRNGWGDRYLVPVQKWLSEAFRVSWVA